MLETASEPHSGDPAHAALSDEVLAELARTATGAREAAFFDLDKTVLTRSSVLAFGREMHRDGLLGTVTLLRGLYAQMVYALSGADQERMEQMRSALLDLVKGWELDRVKRIVRETLEDVIDPLVYGEALELLDRHRAAGRDLWLVSSSGQEIVRPIAEHLDVPDVIASRSRIDDDGRFTGELDFYSYGPHKATAIRQVAEVRGYDLSRCYAYSDSITDLPMLQTVGHPVAVNPDRQLRASAQMRGWKIVDFHSPVSLRQRLPSPSPTPLLLGLGAAAAAAAVWWFHRTPGERTAIGA